MPDFATFDPGITKDLFRFEVYDFGIGSIDADGRTSGFPGQLRVILRQKVDQTRAVLLLVDHPLEIGWKFAEVRDKKMTFKTVYIRQPNRGVTLKEARIIEYHHYIPNPQIIFQFKSAAYVRYGDGPDFFLVDEQ